jgi:FkbM family methyltransferase
VKDALWFVRQSLTLDRRTFDFPGWSLRTKANFILKKYQLIVLHLFRPFQFGQSSTRWAGETIYYDSRFGLAGYQSMLTRPVNLFRTAGIGDFETVIDCGANVGFFSRMITQFAPRARVNAIEPVPAIFECLRRNTLMFPNIRIFQTAISDRPGHLRMSFDSADSAISRVTNSGQVEVAAMTLDDFAADQGIDSIDLLKIDTETFEAHVLRGAKAVLTRTKYLLIEITIEGNTNYSISSLMSLLQAKSYDFQLVAFRNYADTSEGRMPIMDCLMVNQTLLGTREPRAEQQRLA